MRTEHTGNRYAWAYDSIMGVGRFVRLEDDALTMLETGSDCAQVRRDLNRLKTNVGAKDRPKGAPSFEDILDSIAGEYSYG